ncbi:hypothetical protein NL317_31870, partial [Klebsiella pneumoniae]|nr:hypothetical protein [Klebsiella pneumoniae]
GADALKPALKRLNMADEAQLMEAIARRHVTDTQVMEALMPGAAGDAAAKELALERDPITIKGLTPGVAFDLGECCHPVP